MPVIHISYIFDNSSHQKTAHNVFDRLIMHNAFVKFDCKLICMDYYNINNYRYIYVMLVVQDNKIFVLDC